MVSSRDLVFPLKTQPEAGDDTVHTNSISCFRGCYRTGKIEQFVPTLIKESNSSSVMARDEKNGTIALTVLLY